MFTGIIQAVGEVSSLEEKGGDVQMRFATGGLDLSDLTPGDSIAINGVCLTAVELFEDGFQVDVSGETLSCTTFSDLKAGDKINLEKSLLPTTRMGGHIVSGHVDGIGEIVELSEDGRSSRIKIKVPGPLAKYIAAKGSVCVDGISLTVNKIDRDVFDVNIIPHTQENTVISTYQVGTQVNIEVDLIARYLERMLTAQNDDHKKESNITHAFLVDHGFASKP